MPNAVFCSPLLPAYGRYLASLKSLPNATPGENSSTHVASVKLTSAAGNPERAVVKLFQFTDKGWLNEYAAWMLAQHLGVKTSPRAALLVGTSADITKDHGPELRQAVRAYSGPLVLWCTSAVEPTLPIQQVLGSSWERAIMRIDAGHRLAAMDAWLGNCDRFENNILYWSAGDGGLVAIDHEKSVFNQDWTAQAPLHYDEVLDANGNPLAETALLKAIKLATKSKDNAIKKAARIAKSKLFEFSKQTHTSAFNDCQADVEKMAESNFGVQASAHLLSFLSLRISEDCQKRRYGLII